MGFGDLKSPAGLQVLNNYLAAKSYIKWYMASEADVGVFEAVSSPPLANLCHALRWYSHITSYEKEKASLSGVKKALGKYGPANVADTTESGATDSKGNNDDIDRFGSEEEKESEEAKRLREECLAQYESVQKDGLVWVASQLVLVGYGIKKLQIQCVAEDDKVGTDMLEEQITAFDEYVQSKDVAAFNKI
ncbi:hypothetical protein FD755_012505 [Muntiacus reevesi]|uniref:Elongation factor 1-beta n=1 Tax=Muntiacus reevesi TaxID=9886 RepID=A0A5N3XRC1_MUNRE|nr:hypothetical protein FD755_012505 [Muntiacus reevesi]